MFFNLALLELLEPLHQVERLAEALLLHERPLRPAHLLQLRAPLARRGDPRVVLQALAESVYRVRVPRAERRLNVRASLAEPRVLLVPCRVVRAPRRVHELVAASQRAQDVAHLLDVRVDGRRGRRRDARTTRGTNDANLASWLLAEISRRRRPRARRRARRTAASTIARVRRRARHHGSTTAAAPSRRSGDGPSAAPWPLRAALAVPRTKVGTSFSEVLAAYVQYDTYFLSLILKSHTVGPHVCNTRPAANIPSRNFRSRRRRPRSVSSRALGRDPSGGDRTERDAPRRRRRERPRRGVAAADGPVRASQRSPSAPREEHHEELRRLGVRRASVQPVRLDVPPVHARGGAGVGGAQPVRRERLPRHRRVPRRDSKRAHVAQRDGEHLEPSPRADRLRAADDVDGDGLGGTRTRPRCRRRGSWARRGSRGTARGGEALRATVEVRARRRGVAHRASRASARVSSRSKAHSKAHSAFFLSRPASLAPLVPRRSLAARSLTLPVLFDAALRHRTRRSRTSRASCSPRTTCASPARTTASRGIGVTIATTAGDGDDGGESESESGGARVHRHVSFLHLDGAANALRDVASTLRAHLHAPPAPQTTGPDAGGETGPRASFSRARRATRCARGSKRRRASSRIQRT